jgi:hypothetical protein
MSAARGARRPFVDAPSRIDLTRAPDTVLALRLVDAPSRIDLTRAPDTGLALRLDVLTLV